MKNAVIPYEKKLPVEYVYEFKLVDEDIDLNTREEVKAQLPDILGRALARSWVDEEYKEQCEYETTSGQRAKIVVFEQTGRLKLRVCGLSLTMVATR